MTETAFYSLWTPLLQYAAMRGIDRDSAKDLVMETIERVIDRFDPERGEMLHFAYRILGNRIKNYFRDNANTGGLAADIADASPTAHDHAVMKEEQYRAEAVLNSLRTQITAAEIQLLSILQEQIEQSEHYNVSAAARTMGIDPLKAHDMLRRMQRQLLKIQSAADVAEAPVQYSQKIIREEMPVDVCASIIIPEETESFDLLLAQTRDIAVFEKISEYIKKNRR